MPEGLPTAALLFTLPLPAPPVRSQVSRGNAQQLVWVSAAWICVVIWGPGLTFSSFPAFPAVVFLPLRCLKPL